VYVYDKEKGNEEEPKLQVNGKYKLKSQIYTVQQDAAM
jgi:hypothetical protein